MGKVSQFIVAAVVGVAVSASFVGCGSSVAKMADSKMSDGKMSDGKTTDGKMSDGKMTDGKTTVDKMDHK